MSDSSNGALVGAALVPLFKEEARERMLAGKKDPAAHLREGERAPTAAAKVAAALQ